MTDDTNDVSLEEHAERWFLRRAAFSSLSVFIIPSRGLLHSGQPLILDLLLLLPWPGRLDCPHRPLPRLHTFQQPLQLLHHPMRKIHVVTSTKTRVTFKTPPYLSFHALLGLSSPLTASRPPPTRAPFPPLLPTTRSSSMAASLLSTTGFSSPRTRPPSPPAWPLSLSHPPARLYLNWLVSIHV